MKRTAMDYLREAKKISTDIDGGRWALARIAAEMREDKIDRWAEKLAALPNVRRAESTMYEWARTTVFHSTLRRAFKLPFSFFVAAERYADRIELTEIEELLETWEGAEGGTIESFSAMLRDRVGMTVNGPDLGRTLADLMRARDRLGAIGRRDNLPMVVYSGLATAQDALQPALDALQVILDGEGEKVTA